MLAKIGNLEIDIYKTEDFNKVHKALKDAGYKITQYAWVNGYVSRAAFNGNACIVEEYKGKYGKGYLVKRPSWRSTRFCSGEYWTKNT